MPGVLLTVWNSDMYIGLHQVDAKTALLHDDSDGYRKYFGPLDFDIRPTDAGFLLVCYDCDGCSNKLDLLYFKRCRIYFSVLWFWWVQKLLWSIILQKMQSLSCPVIFMILMSADSSLVSYTSKGAESVFCSVMILLVADSSLVSYTSKGAESVFVL